MGLRNLFMSNSFELNVIGDLMLDEHRFYTISKASPEAPVPVLEFKSQKITLGGCGNLAACLSVLGFKVNLFGVCCIDSMGDMKKLFSTYNLEPKNLFATSEIKTTRKLRLIADNQQICRIDEDSSLTEKNLNLFSEYFNNNASKNVLLSLSDYAKGVSDILLENLGRPAPKYIDPKYNDWSRYKNCEFMKANEIELAEAFKFSECSDPFDLMKIYKIKNLIVTRGAMGCTYYSGQNKINIPGIFVDARDVTGAGDSFLAAFIWANEFGYDMKSSLNFANGSAAISVQYIGVYTSNFFEILPFIKNDLMLKPIFANRKFNKVMIGGCFDCLHAGHLSLFHEAIKISNSVVVAINSNDSVSRIKGPARPYQDLETRISNIKKLGFAQKIIPFNEDSPINVLKKECPNAFIKGGDYSGDEEFEDFKYCRENNIQLIIIPTKEGFSSSNIIDEIS